MLRVQFALTQRFFEHENSIFQRLEFFLVLVLTMFLMKVLCDVAHHDHGDGKQATLCGTGAMQPVM